MSSIYKEQDFAQNIILPEVNVVKFLNELRELLDKHNVKLYTTNCELYMNNLGFVGMLEDNIETVEVVDGDEILYTSKQKNNSLQ
tara:strand:- start:45 stop:299 length:255 start_codon:yes stop_codon:yes gene_type:complete